jgi:peptidoglycan/LPS O-acetylase OafA/YrhL
MKQHIPYLDGWRGCAIAFLLIGHFFPYSGINFGTVGVALFFVLSGLLMAQVLFVQRTDFGSFYRRRISRVVPSVVVYLAAITAVFALTGNQVSSSELLSAATFTNNYFVATRWTMPFGHIWSLSVEEHSYVLLSLAAFWCRARGGRGLHAIAVIVSAMLLAIAVYSLVPGAQAPNFYLRTEVASFGIFCSGFLALLVTQGRYALARAWIAPAALAAGIAAHWWSVPIELRVVLGAGGLAVALNAMAYAPRWLLAIFEFSWLRTLGRYSFSIYLWQQPFYQLTYRSGLPPVLGLLLSLIAGWAAFHLIEDPARLYLNKRWGARARMDSYPESAIISR